MIVAPVGLGFLRSLHLFYSCLYFFTYLIIFDPVHMGVVIHTLVKMGRPRTRGGEGGRGGFQSSSRSLDFYSACCLLSKYMTVMMMFATSLHAAHYMDTRLARSLGLPKVHDTSSPACRWPYIEHLCHGIFLPRVGLLALLRSVMYDLDRPGRYEVWSAGTSHVVTRPDLNYT